MKAAGMEPNLSMFTRRQFIQSLAGGLTLVGMAPATCLAQAAAGPAGRRYTFQTRGVVLVPEDLSLADWPERAKQAGLSTIALHHGVSPREVVRLVESDRGQQFLEKCRRLGLNVEYELHAMKELLPRDLFAKDKTLFRMTEKGDRQADCNLCVHSSQALDIIAENALRTAKTLRPTTGRYFFWGDDGQPWCRCEKCRGLSDTDQALLLENHLLKALRRQDPNAQLAHLAYANTLQPPQHVQPLTGVFLEYAPIQRRYDLPYAQQTGAQDKDGLPALDANLKVFPPGTAQVLEYWLDVSRFSGWKRPGVRLPWRKQVFLSDVETYRLCGIRHVTTFAAWIDADYVKRYGELGFLAEYGAGLS
jgi:hypothetical protein